MDILTFQDTQYYNLFKPIAPWTILGDAGVTWGSISANAEVATFGEIPDVGKFPGKIITHLRDGTGPLEFFAYDLALKAFPISLTHIRFSEVENPSAPSDWFYLKDVDNDGVLGTQALDNVKWIQHSIAGDGNTDGNSVWKPPLRNLSKAEILAFENHLSATGNVHGANSTQIPYSSVIMTPISSYLDLFSNHLDATGNVHGVYGTEIYLTGSESQTVTQAINSLITNFSGKANKVGSGAENEVALFDSFGDLKTELFARKGDHKGTTAMIGDLFAVFQKSAYTVPLEWSNINGAIGYDFNGTAGDPRKLHLNQYDNYLISINGNLFVSNFSTVIVGLPFMFLIASASGTNTVSFSTRWVNVPNYSLAEGEWLVITGVCLTSTAYFATVHKVTSGVSTDRSITSFIFEATRNTELSVDQICSINETSGVITKELPFGVSLDGLIPTIVTSPASIVSPVSLVPQDFSSNVGYVVTAQSGDTKAYSVQLTVASQPSPPVYFGYRTDAQGMLATTDPNFEDIVTGVIDEAQQLEVTDETPENITLDEFSLGLIPSDFVFVYFLIKATEPELMFADWESNLGSKINLSILLNTGDPVEVSVGGVTYNLYRKLQDVPQNFTYSVI